MRQIHDIKSFDWLLICCIQQVVQQIDTTDRVRPDSASNHNNQFAPHMLTIETVKGECDIARVNNFSRVSSKLIYYIKTDGSIVLYMTPV